MTIGTVLLVLAFVCFVMAAFNTSVKKVSLVPLGLALLTLAMLLPSLNIKIG